MPTYKESLQIFAETLKPGQLFGRDLVLKWFEENHPDPAPVQTRKMIDLTSVNYPSRKNHASIIANSGHDLFYKEDRERYRLYERAGDSTPIYYADIRNDREEGEKEEKETESSATEFAYESDLRDYLANNLNLIDEGLKLYAGENSDGIEFNAGGRYIDILAVDSIKKFVVIELKVSQGHEKVIGQILRYIGWVKENLAEGNDEVRGIIVARKITNDLRLAARGASGVMLKEYKLSVELSSVEP